MIVSNFFPTCVFIEYVTCSNRGYCNYNTGVCACYEGFGGPACDTATYLYRSSSSTKPAMVLESKQLDFNASVLKINTRKLSSPVFNFLEVIANTQSVFYLRGDGLLALSQVKGLSGGQTVSGGGLAVEKNGFTIAESGISVYNTDTKIPVLKAIAKNTGTFPGYSYAAVEANTYVTDIRDHYYFVGTNREQIKIQVRADGAIFSRGGLHVTSGVSIYNTGMVVNGGISIIGSGMKIKSHGLQLSTGLTVVSEGMKIIQGGLSVFGSGMSINSVGMKIGGGLSVMTVGLAVTNGMRVLSDGVTVREGMSVNSFGVRVTGGLTFTNAGLAITTGGLTISETGMGITTGGMTVLNGGLRVLDGGLEVTNGDLTIITPMYLEGYSVWQMGLNVIGKVKFENGLDIPTSLLNVREGLTVSSGGIVVTRNSIQVNEGMTYFPDGLVVNNNIAVNGDPPAEFEEDITPLLAFSPAAFSDRKLKTDISPIDDALSKVNSLSGVYYHWKDVPDVKGIKHDEHRHVGLIAQEVQEVLPEVVERDSNSTYLKVDYNAVVPLLIEAINELTDHTEEVRESFEKTHLSERIFTRKQKISDLRDRLISAKAEYQVENERQMQLQHMATTLKEAIVSLKANIGIS